jgi:hypothetical protein
MQKLIKRTVFHDHHQPLLQKQDALLEELTSLARDGFAMAQEEWEKSMAVWGASLFLSLFSFSSSPRLMSSCVRSPQQRNTRRNGQSRGRLSSNVGNRGRMKRVDVDKDKNLPLTAALTTTATPAALLPPQKKYRMTEMMKLIVWQLVVLSNECCRLENEKKSVCGFLSFLHPPAWWMLISLSQLIRGIDCTG